MMDRISVIVPVYGVEAYLDRCVRSIVEQTYPDLEIILVDDGSPDNCGAMCDAWAERDSRIKVIHKENGGLSDARNAGLAVATGEYIAFVDSDDLIAATYIQQMYDAIRKTGAPMAACDVLAFGKEAEISAETTGGVLLRSAEEALRDLTSGVGIRAVAWNKLYHHTLMKEELFPVGKHHEDEYFTYRMIHKAKSVAYVDATLYFYRQRQGSIMDSFSIKRLDALDAYLQRLELFGTEYPEIYRKDKATFCVSCVMFYAQGLRSGFENMDLLYDQIMRRRKKLRFSVMELASYPLKANLYILGSRFGLRLLGRRLAGRNDG